MTKNLKILKFKIKDIIFGIELKYVKETGKISDFFKLPSEVDYFEGLFNLRGNIIPLINLGLKAGISYSFNKKKENFFILINDSQYLFGIFVDKIIGINILQENEIIVNFTNNNTEIIDNIINTNGEIIVIVNVKSIIEPEDFKFKKQIVFKTIDEFKEESSKQKEVKEKISYAIFKFSNNYYAIEAKYIKQLIEPASAKFNLSELNSLISGEIEFENKIMPVLNLAYLTGLKLKLSSNINDYYIAIIEANNKTISLLVYYTTEFVEIYKDNILKNEDLLSNLNFITECFRIDDKLIKIIDANKLVETLLSRKALEI